MSKGSGVTRGFEGREARASQAGRTAYCQLEGHSEASPRGRRQHEARRCKDHVICARASAQSRGTRQRPPGSHGNTGINHQPHREALTERLVPRQAPGGHGRDVHPPHLSNQGSANKARMLAQDMFKHRSRVCGQPRATAPSLRRGRPKQVPAQARGFALVHKARTLPAPFARRVDGPIALLRHSHSHGRTGHRVRAVHHVHCDGLPKGSS